MIKNGAVKSIQSGTINWSNKNDRYNYQIKINLSNIDPNKSFVILFGLSEGVSYPCVKAFSLTSDLLTLTVGGNGNYYSGYLPWQVIEFY